MHTSHKGLEFIARFEGCVLHPYNDIAHNATIGIGHLIHPGPVTPADVKRWGTISKDEALHLLRHDVLGAETTVKDRVHVHLDQHQLDALVDFVFNIGSGAFASSTLLRLLNEGHYSRVPAELAKWVHAGGQVLDSMKRRRAAEAHLFTQGKYE